MAENVKMVAENKQPDEVFTVKDVLKSFYVLLNTIGGKMTVRMSVLKNNVPKDFMKKIKIEHLPPLGEQDFYRISIIKKRHLGILRPNRRLIVP